MVTTEEGWHTVEDGEKLYTKTWKPDGEVKAKLVFVHGFSDHCNAYGIFFPELAARGIEVFGFDQRGWGRTVKKPSDRGVTGATTLVLSDITSVLSAHLPSPVPLFLMGHSMGGGEVLTYAADGPPATVSQIRGVLTEAPLITVDPKSAPWGPTVAAGRLIAKVLPNAQMVHKLDPKVLSRDPEVQQAWAADPLCHDTGTLLGFTGMLDRAAGLAKGSIRVKEGTGEGGKTRLWISHGTEDLACAFAGTKAWFETHLTDVQDKEFKVYEGWFHKLHAEPGEDKNIYAKDVGDWILKRVD